MNPTRDSDDQGSGERARLVAQIASFQEGLEEARLTSTVDMLMTAPLTIRQLKVLGIIVAGGGTSTSQGLASSIGVSLATVSGLVDRLVESGMVVREPNPSDHRVQNLVATRAANAMLQDLAARSNQIRTDALNQMPLEDLQALTQGIRALAKILLEKRD